MLQAGAANIQGSLVGKSTGAQHCPPETCLKLEVGLGTMAEATGTYLPGTQTKWTCLGFERGCIAEKLGYPLKTKYYTFLFLKGFRSS